MSDTENVQNLINERNDQNKRIEQLVLEIERLNNIINELEKWLEENIKTKPLLTTYFFECDGKQKSISGIELEELKRVLNKLKALKKE